MPGKSQGSGYPDNNSSSTRRWVSPPRPVRRGRVDSQQFHLARRLEFAAWLAQCDSVSAAVPIWLSRRCWIAGVLGWAATDDGRAALRSAHLSGERFARVVPTLARFADGGTGRNVAVTNGRVAAAAGVCERIVTTTRRILGHAGWAVEAARGYGHAGGRRNRPSVWHLVPRRRPSAGVSRRGAVCDLPSKRHSDTAVRRWRRVTYTPSGWRAIWPRTAMVYAARILAGSVMYCSAATFGCAIGPASSWCRRWMPRCANGAGIGLTGSSTRRGFWHFAWPSYP